MAKGNDIAEDGKSRSNFARRKATVLQSIMAVVVAVAMSVVVITGTFQLLLTPVPTQVFASWGVEDDLSPMDHDYLVNIACQTLAYCNADPNAQLPLGSNERTQFTPNVMSHLDDVTAFFSGTKVAFCIGAVALAIAILALYAICRKERVTREHDVRDVARRGSNDEPRGLSVRCGSNDEHRGLPFKRLIARSMISCACIVIAVAVVVGLAAAIDFYDLFNLLHSLFFSSGSWLFSYDSLLICSLPQPFWEAMGVFWGILIAVACAALAIVGIRLKRKNSINLA